MQTLTRMARDPVLTVLFIILGIAAVMLIWNRVEGRVPPVVERMTFLETFPVDQVELFQHSEPIFHGSMGVLKEARIPSVPRALSALKVGLGARVTLHELPNFGGKKRLVLGPGEHDLTRYAFNDVTLKPGDWPISRWDNKIYVFKEGQRAPFSLCGGTGFGTDFLSGGGVQNVGRNCWNDKAQSLVVTVDRSVKPPPPRTSVAFFNDINFKSPMGAVYAGQDVRNMSSLGGSGRPDNSVSSIEVGPGRSVMLYQHTDFGGKSLFLKPGKYPNLGWFAFKNGSDSRGSWTEGQYVGMDVCGKNNSGCWNDTVSSFKVR